MSPQRLRRVGLLAVSAAAVALVALLPGHARQAAGKRYALLVGVSDYKNAFYTNLSGTENDVVELARVLEKPSSGFASIRLLTTTRGKKDPKDAPTAANIRKELEKLAAGKGRDDTVLIALAGHGADVEVPDPDGKRPARTYTYFFPADADDLDNISYSTGHSERLIELGNLFKRLEAPRCGAGAKLVLIDACRDSLTAKASTRSLTPTRVTVPSGVSVIFSCGPGEAAFEAGFDIGAEQPRVHGVFFYHVIRGLEGEAARRGKVTWADLTSYVQGEVPAYVRRLRKSPHHPHAILNLEREVVLVQAGREKVVRAAKELTNSIGLRLVRVPEGKFTMGSPPDEEDRQQDEGPEHEVVLSRPFYLGVYEVTQGQYERVMGKNPSHFAPEGAGKDKVRGVDTSQFPVEMVSWDDAVEFCRRLSELPEEKRAGRKYRLPTEAEWEYACRAGSPSYQAFHVGNALSSRQANFNGNSPYGGAEKGEYLGRTAKVGSYKPNAFGLYDMHGGVWEWCADRYDKDYYKSSPRADPPGPREAAGPERVLRGGSWASDAADCRAARRLHDSPAARPYRNRGFRVALNVSGE
jgi:formylglycine-generating enzyme required for sulfatase activity/uncharacterized caspase-like protein